jgi:hypothetical protein
MFSKLAKAVTCLAVLLVYAALLSPAYAQQVNVVHVHPSGWVDYVYFDRGRGRYLYSAFDSNSIYERHGLTFVNVRQYYRTEIITKANEDYADDVVDFDPAYDHIYALDCVNGRYLTVRTEEFYQSGNSRVFDFTGLRQPWIRIHRYDDFWFLATKVC